MAKKRIRRKNKRIKLFHQQGAKCYYCDCKMTLKYNYDNLSQPRENFATFEHIEGCAKAGYSRSSLEDVVLCCFKCNNLRSKFQGSNPNLPHFTSDEFLEMIQLRENPDFNFYYYERL